MRVIMLVDLDYFFAQCEQLRNPALKEKPVVVCVYSGRSEDSGAVSTANYVARKYGVRSGMPIFLAKKKLEKVDAAFLPVDYQFYEGISGEVMRILKSFADEFEQVSIDEAYLDVTRRTDGSYQNAGTQAETIKGELRKQLRLTCSIGIGPNKLVAKIAADEKKPDGLTIIEPDHVTGFLAPLPVDRLIGVGAKTVERMHALGINKIDDLAKSDVQKLIAIFGKALSNYFHKAAQGLDDEPVQQRGEAESISRIATLKQNTRDLETILEKVDALCNDLHSRILEEELTFKTVGVIAITTDVNAHTRSMTLDNSSNSVDLMKKTARELFEKFLSENQLEIRRAGVKLSSLSRTEKNQTQITHFFK